MSLLEGLSSKGNFTTLYILRAFKNKQTLSKFDLIISGSLNS